MFFVLFLQAICLLIIKFVILYVGKKIEINELKKILRFLRITSLQAKFISQITNNKIIDNNR